IPIIYLDKNNKQEITAIDGTAVIKKDKMVGELDKEETAGLNLLLNNVQGGSIQVDLDENEKVSMEINKLKTKTTPKLTGDKVDVIVEVKINGTLGDNMTPNKIDEKLFKIIEGKISEHIEATIQSTLNKLQQEYKTDITKIGLETYRKYIQEWKDIQSKRDEEIYAKANVLFYVRNICIH